MKETEQLKKLMEAMSPVKVGDLDPMTGEREVMPDNVISFDRKASPEEVINTINQNLAGWGIQFKTYTDGSYTLYVEIKNVDY